MGDDEGGGSDQLRDCRLRGNGGLDQDGTLGGDNTGNGEKQGSSGEKEKMGGSRDDDGKRRSSGRDRTAKHQQTEQEQGPDVESMMATIEEEAEMDAVKAAMAEALMATEKEAAHSQENRDARGA